MSSRGFFLAANGAINQQRILDMTSNNLANVKTSGYKTDKFIPTTFERRLLLLRGKNNDTGTIEYRTSDIIQTNLEQGTFEFTGRALDVALKGNVYFNIQPSGTLYGEDTEKLLTRNGQFNIDDEGYLALGSAGRVLGEDGPIQIGTSAFYIDEKGLVTTEYGDTYQLRLSYIDDAEDIQKKGDNMFTSPTEEEEIPADAEYAVVQGAYERSNVNVGEEMMKAMEAQRLFDSCMTGLKMFDAIDQKAANEIGKV